MRPETKKIWISWERHRRTREMAGSLTGFRLFEIEFDGPRTVRYPILLVRTLWILIREKPDTVVVQNPSIVLALLMVSIGKFFTRNVIVDAHNEGLKPFFAKYNILLPIYRYIQKAADLTIVTNRQLAALVKRNGGNAYILEDRLPRFSSLKAIKLNGKNNLVFVCTFEKDEPFRAVIESAKKIPNDTFIYVTGKKAKAGWRLIASAPENIVFTDFLPDRDYANLMFSSDAVIDLTYMENCLVCGAYEALALSKPAILSDTQALRNYFKRGAVFTANEPDAIAKAVQETITRKAEITEEAAIFKKSLQSLWDRKCRSLNEIIAKRDYHRSNLEWNV